MIPQDSSSFSPLSAQMQQHLQNLNQYLNKNFSDPVDIDDDDEPYDEDQDLISPNKCNYFDYEEFQQAKFNSSKSFSIFHYNIHSIQKHVDSLRTLLLMIESKNFQFDILAITESKIHKKSQTLVEIRIENYHDPMNIP